MKPSLYIAENMTVDTALRRDSIPEEPEEEFSEEEDGHYVTDRIIIPSPRVSVEERELPILVRSAASFEERIVAANPEAAAPVELSPCDTCGRKFNPSALERHVKVRRWLRGFLHFSLQSVTSKILRETQR